MVVNEAQSKTTPDSAPTPRRTHPAPTTMDSPLDDGSALATGSPGQLATPLQLSVVDVYEAASEIGTDLEHLAQQYGRSSIEKLVPKICAVLEQLEQLAQSADKEQARQTAQHLQTALHTLELYQQEKRHIRERHHQEMEELESDWREENKRLEGALLDLTGENEKLRNALRTSVPSEPATPVTDIDRRFGDLTLTTSTPAPPDHSGAGLKETLGKVKEELRDRDAALQDAHTDLAKLRGEVERDKINLVTSRQRHNTLHKQARRLMEEKNNLTGLLRQSVLAQTQLQERLKAAGVTVSVPVAPDAEGHLKALFDRRNSSPLVSPEEEVETPVPAQEPLRLVQSQRVIEASDQLDDGDLPRFTLNELRRMLNERNHLKAKVMELQDEIAAGKARVAVPAPADAHLQPWRPDAATGDKSTTTSSVADEAEREASVLQSGELDSTASFTDDEEAPVQGPINREPDDKLYPGRRRKSKPRPSIIRNLYKGLFGEKYTALVKEGGGIFYKFSESRSHLAD